MVVAYVADQIDCFPGDFIDIKEYIPSRMVVLGKDRIIHILPELISEFDAKKCPALTAKRLSEYAKA